MLTRRRPSQRSRARARASFQHSRFSTFRGALECCTSASRKRSTASGRRGATILRRYSQEPLDPYDYKHPHLLEIVDANPAYKWILFGDTGEKDPEVYHTLIEERPGTVDAVYIHNVTNANPLDGRFAGFTVFTDWDEVLAAFEQRG